MLTWLRWGIAGIALINVVALVAIGAAFGWHYRLKPRLQQRRARQRSFERLLERSPIDNTPAMAEPHDALEAHGARHV